MVCGINDIQGIHNNEFHHNAACIAVWVDDLKKVFREQFTLIICFMFPNEFSSQTALHCLQHQLFIIIICGIHLSAAASIDLKIRKFVSYKAKSWTKFFSTLSNIKNYYTQNAVMCACIMTIMCAQSLYFWLWHPDTMLMSLIQNADSVQNDQSKRVLVSSSFVNRLFVLIFK